MKPEPLDGKPLVVCAFCGSTVEKEDAEKRSVESRKGVAIVWMCAACKRLGKGADAQKYIMKAEKTRGR